MTLLLLWGCDSSPPNLTPRDGGPDSGPADADTGEEPDPDCDPLVPGVCALPWPSNLYLEPSAEHETGFTLAFGDASLPANINGTHPDPAPYRRLDGYTVGSSIIVSFPGLDVSSLPSEESIEASVADDSPILLLELRDGGVRQIPCWAELDARADDPSEALLFVRPAEILRHGTRYLVAFRELLDEAGDPIEPSPAFRMLREGDASDHPTLGPRVSRFEELFEALSAAGVERESLILAWDFVTASRSVALGDMLSIRDQAYELAGPDGAELTIDHVQTFAREDDGSGNPIDPNIAFEVFGTFRVPDFTEPVTLGTGTVYRLHRDEAGEPATNGWVDREFVAMIPHPDPDDPRPLELMEYGHGLLGTFHQVLSGYNRRVAAEHELVYFGASLTGFSDPDTDIIVNAVMDGRSLECFTERLHQGVMEYLLLARGVRQRFSDLSEIADLGVDIDSSKLYYSGISQGGIYGATVMALSQDITRGHLGVPGSNYALLMERSVDFTPYIILISMFYPTREAQIIFVESLANLWQTTDPVSYYRSITAEPLPETPVHHVLLAQAQGDWQVAPVTNEIAARSDLGVALMEGYGREVALVEPPLYPYLGSALVNYSFGDPWAEPGNRHPLENGEDPHDRPRNEPHHNLQMVHFLRTGEVIDVCGGDGCTPD